MTNLMWPPDVPSTLTRQVWDTPTARTIPGVGRALGVYGMIAQCSLLHMAGSTQLPSSPFLDQPDLDLALANFLRVHIEDYWLQGNAAHLVTARSEKTGWPLAVKWYPAHQWSVRTGSDGGPDYYLNGRRVPNRNDIVHVQRGADPNNPWRGMGVVEEHLRTLNRAGLQEAAETSLLQDRGMPAVAVIKPNPEPDPENDDKVADKWMERFSGPARRPGIFPQGTQVLPLSWSPTDAQLVEARQMSLVDLANGFNLDGYWLGAPNASLTYQSPGPNFLQLVRVSLAPVMRVFEQVWSVKWLPRGRAVEIDRVALLRDNLAEMVTAFAAGKAAGIFPDVNEIRRYIGFPDLTDEQLGTPAAEPVDEQPADAPADDVPDDADQTEEIPA